MDLDVHSTAILIWKTREGLLDWPNAAGRCGPLDESVGLPEGRVPQLPLSWRKL
jgi:hypothetical protein